VRRLLLVPVLVLAATAALAAPAGAGNQWVSVGGEVSVVLPAGWHVVRGRTSYVVDPIPRAFATFHVRFARHSCECGMPNVTDLPRDGAFVFAWEYRRISRRDLRFFPAHTPRFRIGHSAITGACAPSDGRTFREGGRAFQVEIYLGPDAPASARRQIAVILDSWQVAPPGRVSPEAS
jgi:hypothetical protein